MRIAFVGKGGSGKTTTAALFSRYTAGLGRPVLAVDADINQHLGVALGADPAAPPPRALGGDLTWLKDHVRGENPLLPSADTMIKTTPPGPGSRMLSLDPSGELLQRYSAVAGGVRYLVTGAFDEADIGVSCYHSKTGAVELYLNHLLDGPGEYVAVDMTAGADAFASGLFTRFDLTVLVCEPTRRGVGVFRQYADYAAEHGVALRVLGNKVTDDSDVAYLRDEVGDALIGCLGQSAWVRAAERGAVQPVEDLEPANRTVLARILADLDGRTRDWAAYHRGTVEFHLRNAKSWGDKATGVDLAAQVHPTFVPA
ncbi:ATP-binding protein [Pseudonocardia sp. WMMC193]|uniref:ATP-binding protein n=1 Tax=Pseudonocardia sp. WMMC193 TaxID=2911965 RepID=UPI001F29935A|nr:ATP-binding protein [Pseudonocardia sp. WMMC193]MCF7548070.1 ATP-binding protein [Pseudonocardia sp. WMMC193]